MYIFTTIDNNFPEIWETSGIAIFSSKFEDVIICENINRNLSNELHAIGIYRASKSNLPQSYAPSLLRITGAKFVPGTQYDIRITFIFLRKLPFEVNVQLHIVKNSPFPLIKKISENFLAV